jgi:hypothetical protein
VVVVAEPFSEAVVVLDHDGSASYLDNVEVVVGTAPRSPSSPCRTGPTTPSTCPTTTCRSAGTRRPHISVSLGG